jgi:hypothetical protein
MKTAKIKSAVAAFLVVGALGCQAQVYSIRVGSTVGGGTLVYQLDHDWVIGTPPNRFGLLQYRQKVGASSDAPLVPYTTVYFASRNFTLPMSTLAVAVTGLVVFSALAILPVTMSRRIRRYQENEVFVA